MKRSSVFSDFSTILLCFKEENTFPLMDFRWSHLQQVRFSGRLSARIRRSAVLRQYQYCDGWGAARSYISWECKDNRADERLRTDTPVTSRISFKSSYRAADSSDAWAIINSIKQLWVFLLLNKKFKWMVNIRSCGHSHSPSERTGFFLFVCFAL